MEGHHQELSLQLIEEVRMFQAGIHLEYISIA